MFSRGFPSVVLAVALVAGLGLTVLRVTDLRPLWAVRATAFVPWAIVALLTACGLAVVVLGGAWRATVVVGALALAGLHVYWQAPLFLGQVRAVPTGVEPVRILTMNAWHGDADVDRILALVRDRGVDVLSIQEVSPALRESLREGRLDQLLPYSAGEPGETPDGTMLFSRYPLGDARLAGPGHGNWLVTADTPLGPLRIIALHPYAPITSGAAWWEGQEVIRRTAEDADVLAGDFNATLDHPTMRWLEADGFRSSAVLSNAGLRATWPAGGLRRVGPIPLPPMVQIDHVMVRTSVWTATFTGFPDVAGSDHRAVLADLIPS